MVSAAEVEYGTKSCTLGAGTGHTGNWVRGQYLLGTYVLGA